MNPPDFREAACCQNCFWLAGISSRCMKYGKKIDYDSFYVCASFEVNNDPDISG